MSSHSLHKDYPWTSPHPPLIISAPMRLIALAPLAVAVSSAGGIGFIGSGSDATDLEEMLAEASQTLPPHLRPSSNGDTLPIGVGFLLWSPNLLATALPAIQKFRPAAVWLFAPNSPDQLTLWAKETRRVTNGKTKIWIQVGSVADAVAAWQACKPDVVVAQGVDAGGHGLIKGAGILSLLPEIRDKITTLAERDAVPPPAFIAAGGIMDSRGAAAALALGAEGVVLGTALLGSHEATVPRGYRDAVLRAGDGGVQTARGKLYDSLRGTVGWPEEYGGRGVLNESWWDSEKGVSLEENRKKYEEAVEKGDEGWKEGEARLTTYAGAGVGLLRAEESAGMIVQRVREDARRVVKEMAIRVGGR